MPVDLFSFLIVFLFIVIMYGYRSDKMAIIVFLLLFMNIISLYHTVYKGDVLYFQTLSYFFSGQEEKIITPMAEVDLSIYLVLLIIFLSLIMYSTYHNKT